MRHARSDVLASLYATLALVGVKFVGCLVLGTHFIPELIAQQIFALGTPRLLPAVRATDGQGNLQAERITESLPDDASGYHKIRVKVKAT